MKPHESHTGSDELHQHVAEALEAYEQGGTAALEQVCERHPEFAPALRQRVHGLAALGLLDEVGASDVPPERLGDFVPLRRLGGGAWAWSSWRARSRSAARSR